MIDRPVDKKDNQIKFDFLNFGNKRISPQNSNPIIKIKVCQIFKIKQNHRGILFPRINFTNTKISKDKIIDKFRFQKRQITSLKF